MIRFGENVKQFRKANRLTQTDFAVRLNDKLSGMGMDINYNNKSISMWENNERVPDNAIVWVAVSEIIGISVDALLKGENATYDNNYNVAENLADIKGSFMETVNCRYVEQFIEADTYSNLDANNIADIFLNVDSYDSQTEIAHSMLIVLSKVDALANAKQYVLDSVEKTYEYLRQLHTKTFVKESEFLKGLGVTSVKDCPYAYSKKITDFWGTYLDTYNIFTGFDCSVMYDSNYSQILTVVDCEFSIDEATLMATMAEVYAKGINGGNALYKAMLANSKTILGMKYAKDKWHKNK